MNGSFFKGSAGFSVEARDASGAKVNASERNAVALIQAITSKLSHAIAVTALMVAAMSQPAASMPANSLVQPLAGETTEMAYVRVSTSDFAKKAVSRFNVNDQKVGSNDGPSMSYSLDRQDNLTCNLSMYGIENVFAMMGQGRAALTNVDRQIMLPLIIIHEIAHCEVKASEMLKERSGQENVQTMELSYMATFIQSTGPLKDASIAMTILLHTLMIERQADIKTVLIVARLVLDKNDIKMPEKLALFDRHIEGLKLIRTSEGRMRSLSADSGSFNDHDTLSVITMVQSLVHKAAATPEALKDFRDTYLEGDKPALTAMSLAVGSVRAEKEILYKKIVSDASADIKRILVAPASKQLIDAQKISASLKSMLVNPDLSINIRSTGIAIETEKMSDAQITASLAISETSVAAARQNIMMFNSMDKAVNGHPIATYWPADSAQTSDVQKMLVQADKSYEELSSAYSTIQSHRIPGLINQSTEKPVKNCFDWDGVDFEASIEAMECTLVPR